MKQRRHQGVAASPGSPGRPQATEPLLAPHGNAAAQDLLEGSTLTGSDDPLVCPPAEDPLPLELRDCEQRDDTLPQDIETPRLTFQTDSTEAHPFGRAAWKITWLVSPAYPFSGVIVQHVEKDMEVWEGSDDSKPVRLSGTECDLGQWPLWEAWTVCPGTGRTANGETPLGEALGLGAALSDTTLGDDTFGNPTVGDDTHGWFEIRSDAVFYAGASIPASMTVVRGSPAGELPMSRSAPDLDGEPSNHVVRTFRGEWDASGDKTRITIS